MSQDVLRRSQLLTTFGPGALIDLPNDAVIVGGVDHWYFETGKVPEHIIHEPRLTAKLAHLAPGRSVGLRLPPIVSDAPQAKAGVKCFLFPQWCVVQSPNTRKNGAVGRRLIHRKDLDQVTARTFRDPDSKRKEKIVPMRFVRACPKGHIDDINWREFVHKERTSCSGALWLEEFGTTGALAEMQVACDCGAKRRIGDVYAGAGALGQCSGERPWLGAGHAEACSEASRILVRSATNAHFPIIMSVISVPDSSSQLASLVDAHWETLEHAKSSDVLASFLRIPALTELAQFPPDEVWAAVEARRKGLERQSSAPVKDLEFEAFAQAPESVETRHGLGDFVVRRLAAGRWERLRDTGLIESIVLADRIREVSAMVGFTRLSAMSNEVNGELNDRVEPAPLSDSPDWFPAAEVRGEGFFVQLSPAAVERWAARRGVQDRMQKLETGFNEWAKKQGEGAIRYPGVEYYLLHSLSHLLMTAISLECGYPGSSLKERIYSNAHEHRYGLLIYTGATDAEGTLGGLVQAGEGLEKHILRALASAELCSGDPICAHHTPDHRDERPLQGAACHGCLYVPETSCEQRNEFLDRSLVVSTLERAGAEFFTEDAIRILRS